MFEVICDTPLVAVRTEEPFFATVAKLASYITGWGGIAVTNPHGRRVGLLLSPNFSQFPDLKPQSNGVTVPTIYVS